jgi:hypothetical protein
MRLRTLALVIAVGCGLATGAVAKKKTSHSAAATVKRTKIKKIRPQGVNRKVKSRKVVKHKTAHR